MLRWRAPDELTGLTESGCFPDAALRDGWNAGRDRGVEPGISASWFPAWMLLQKPELAREAARAAGDSGPEAAFNQDGFFCRPN